MRGSETLRGGHRRRRARARAGVVVLALVTVGLAQLPPTLAPLPPTLAPLPPHGLEERFLQLTNEERARAEVPALRPSATLAQAARHHAEEMVRLGYVSHVSPTADRADVADRVVLVGGTTVSVGENLAAVTAGGADLPERVTAGWMQSEGHRRNLLTPRWTHVGFGAHEGQDGRLYVVQVFTFDPNPLLSAHVTWADSASLAVRFEVTSTRSGVVEMGRVGAPMATEAVAADEPVTLVLDHVDTDAPTHIGLGWSADQATGMIGQESGWYDPNTRAWAIDHRSDAAVARVLSFASSPAARDLSLHLAFERAPHDVVVFVDGRPLEGDVTGTSMLVAVPGREGDLHVEIGVAVDDGRVAVAHELTVGVRGARAEVRGGGRE